MSVAAQRRPYPGLRATMPARVAMVGAGQLARMTHQAAVSLGLELRVLAVSESDPAVDAGADYLLGSFEDIADVRALANGCDVLTFDHEGVPTEHLLTLEDEGLNLAPGDAAKRLAQDKLHARRVISELGFPTPAWTHARNLGEVKAFANRHGWPIVAKAPRGGYDGRGVWMAGDVNEAGDILESCPDGLLLEPCVAIEKELAVMVARSTTGQRACYPVVETVQRDAMCREIIAPAPVASETAAKAVAIASEIATVTGTTGMLAVEFFLTPEGLLVNELALRPHNSGHFTIEGCVTSQFEQHLRAILGMPLGLPSLIAPSVATFNVIGQADGVDPRTRLARVLEVPGAHVHLYGKLPAPGRKLGHVTVCGQDPGPVREAARLAAATLEGRPS